MIRNCERGTLASPGQKEGHEDVRVFNTSTLHGFGKEHPDADTSVRELSKTLRAAQWAQMADVIAAYPSATVLNGERVVFKIKGNFYRAIVAFDFSRQAAFVKFLGTHSAYDRINALTVNLFGTE